MRKGRLEGLMKLQEFRSGHFFDQLEVGGGDGNVFKYLFGSYFRSRYKVLPSLMPTAPQMACKSVDFPSR